MAVLVVAETDGANLPRGTLATITAAIAIDPEVDVLVLDEQSDEASQAASGNRRRPLGHQGRRARARWQPCREPCARRG